MVMECVLVKLATRKRLLNKNDSIISWMHDVSKDGQLKMQTKI